MKKILKKSLACMLAAILCLTACVGAMATVGAEGAITYSIESVVIPQGGRDTIDVTISNFADVAGLIAEITLPDAVDSIGDVKLNDSVPLVKMTDETAGHYVVDGKTVKFVGLFGPNLNEFGQYGIDDSIKTLVININVTVVNEAREPASITATFTAGDYYEQILAVTGTDGSLTVEAVCEHTDTTTVEENIVAATCYAEGSYDEVVKCSCGHVVSSTPKTIEKIAHTPAEAVVENNVDATCYKEGSYDSVVYCSVEACKAEISRTPVTVGKTEHTPAEAVVENNVDATCYAEGSYDSVVYCSVANCKHEISRTPITVEKIAHTPAEAVEENRVEAKPGVAGSYESVVYCSVAKCGAEISRTTNEIPALPVEPECDHANKVFYTDETHSYVPATGTSSAETSKGQIFFKCSDCDEIIEEEVSYYHYYATGNSNLALESEISAQFYLREDHYNRQGTPTDAIIVLNKSNYGKAATDYVFKFAETKPAIVNGKAAYMANIGVAAKEMNDNISTYVFVEYNGKWYNGMSITKSIKIFAMDSITAATSASNPLTLKQLYANMLTYGSKAQINYDYDTENLVDAGLVGEYASLVNTEEPVIEDKGVNPLLEGRDHIGFNSFSLVLGAKVEISIGYRTDFYKGDEVFGDLHPECTYTSVDGKDLTWSTTNVTSTQANRYTFTFDGAAAKDMRQMIRFYVHNAEGPVGYYLDTSIETVARRLIDSNSNNTKLCDVVKAMIVYGDAAAVYFAS